jgi:hypothetical protein
MNLCYTNQLPGQRRVQIEIPEDELIHLTSGMRSAEAEAVRNRLLRLLDEADAKLAASREDS